VFACSGSSDSHGKKTIKNVLNVFERRESVLQNGMLKEFALKGLILFFLLLSRLL